MLDSTIGLNHGFLLTLGVELLGVVLDTTVGCDHDTECKGTFDTFSPFGGSVFPVPFSVAYFRQELTYDAHPLGGDSQRDCSYQALPEGLR